MWSNLPQELADEIVGYLIGNDEDYAILRQVSKTFCRPLVKTVIWLPLKLFVTTIPRIIWARENGCPVSDWFFDHAAASGNLEVLKYLKDNFYPWEEMTCAFAAEQGQFEALKWLRANRCPWDRSTYYFAKEGDRREILEWAKDNGAPCGEFSSCYISPGGRWWTQE